MGLGCRARLWHWRWRWRWHWSWRGRNRLSWLRWQWRPVSGIRVDVLPQMQLAGVVGDLVDPIEPVVRALENYRGNSLGRHIGDRGKFKPFKVVLVGKESPDRRSLAVGRQ